MPSTQLAAPGAVITADLERAVEPAELLIHLRAFGFSDRDLASGTGTLARSVRRWRQGAPGTSAASHLGELRNLVVFFRRSEALTDQGTVWWLRHANRLLEDYSPLSVIGAGGFRSARAAAMCFIDTERVFDCPLDNATRQRLSAKTPGSDSDTNGKLSTRPALTSVS